MKRDALLFVLGGIVLSALHILASPSLTSSSMHSSQLAPSSFVFTAAGDHGVGTTPNASMDVIKNSGSSFYLALGDLSYTAGGEQRWCTNFKSRFNDVEILAGNHDTGESTGGNIDQYIQHCPFTLDALTGTYGKQYYFDYPSAAPLARFIMIAPGVRGSLSINYNVGGAGYTFTRDAIDTARAAGIKWIIVGMHKNCISMGQKSCEVGTDIMNLLIQKKVDLILQSHDHNYQRSHQLKCIKTRSIDRSCIADDGTDGLYTQGDGTVIIINGEFGRPLYSVNTADTEAGYFAKADSTTWGVTKYTVSDTAISGHYLRSAGGGFADSYTISAPPSDNQLTNPNFELDVNNDGQPDGWSTNSRFTRSSQDAYSGTYAGTHAATDDTGYTISQPVNGLAAGQTYRFSGWVNIPSTTDAFSFRLQVRWRNATNATISTTPITTYSAATNGWRHARATFVAPAGTTNAQVLMTASSLNATINVDDFRFTAVANQLANPSFELDVNSDGQPDSWSTNSRFTRSSQAVYSGTYAGTHAATDNGGYTIVSDPMSGLTEGTLYSFSGRVNIPSTTDPFTVKLQVRWRNASNSIMSTSTIKTYRAATSGWDLARAALVAPPGTTNAQVIMVVSSLNATIYVDDVVFGP